MNRNNSVEVCIISVIMHDYDAQIITEKIIMKIIGFWVRVKARIRKYYLQI